MGNCLGEQQKTEILKNINNNLTKDNVLVEKCPICLDAIDNKSYANTCLHTFCFVCLQEWSQSHNRCPICRRVYTCIFHNIKSDTNYEHWPLPDPIHPNQLPGPSGNFDTFSFDTTAIVLRTGDLGLCAVYSIEMPNGTIFWDSFYLYPNRIYFISDNIPDLQLVLPQNLVQTLTQLYRN